MKNELAIKKSYELGNPEQVAEMATILKSHVVKHKLFSMIVGKAYVQVEGWQFAGGLLGMFPRVVSIENLSKDKEIKWQAEVEIVNIRTDKVIGRGFAICSSAEGKKKGFDEYAILSMAQTRAIGKAYRNVIGWVMKLAGYEPTPSEEMANMSGEVKAKSTKEEVAPKIEAECANDGNPLTKAEKEYSLKLFKKPLCRACQSEARKK